MSDYFSLGNWIFSLAVIFLTGCFLQPASSFAEDPVVSPDELRTKMNSSADMKEKYRLANELSNFFFASNRDSMIYYDEKGVEFALALDNDSLLAEAYYFLGNSLMTSNSFQETITRFLPLIDENYSDEVKIALHFSIHRAYLGLGLIEECKIYLDRAQTLLGENEYHRLSFTYQMAIGDYYLTSGDYLTALYAYEEALTLVNDGYFGSRSTALQGLIVVYQIIGIHERAIEMAQEEINTSLSNGDDYGAIYSYFLHGESQYHLGDTTSALNSAREAIKISQESGIKNSIGFAYFQVGRIYLELGQLDSARWYAEEGVKISRENGDRKETGECLCLLSELHVRNEEYSEALRIANEVLSMNLYVGLNYLAYESMAEASAGLGAYEDAYQYLNKIQIINDSLDVVEPAIKISSELMEKDFVQKEKLSQLEYEQEVTKWQTVLIIISSILLFLFIISFSVYKNLSVSKQNQYLDRLNRSLKSRNDALKKFTFMTSHDLLEPVRVIGSMTGLLIRKLREGETVKNLEKLSFIQDSVKTLSVMTSGVKEYAEVLDPESSWDHFSLQTLQEDVENWNSSMGFDEKGSLTISFDSGPKMLSYPYNQLTRILEHLITNSFQANLSSNLLTVSLSTARDNDFIIFKVADNGIGINQEYQEQIFEPFKTLENKLISQRSGLGLSICKMLVENNGGRIWIDSTLEPGVTVNFSIPMNKPEIL